MTIIIILETKLCYRNLIKGVHAWTGSYILDKGETQTYELKDKKIGLLVAFMAYQTI